MSDQNQVGSIVDLNYNYGGNGPRPHWCVGAVQNQSYLPIGFTKVRDVKSPTKKDGDAGWDFYIPNNYKEITLRPLVRVLIPSGIHVKLPKDHAFIAFNKSGVATKMGLCALGCVIDESYMGEVHISLVNVSNDNVLLKPGMKILQFILLPVPYCSMEESSTIEDLYGDIVTDRGTGGFGSTGEF